MWIAIGVFVTVAVVSLAIPALSLLLGPGSVLSVAVAVLLFLAGPAIGGALAGRSLRLGKRGGVGFAIAFAISLPILMVPWMGVQGMHGNESIARLVVTFGGTAVVAFALMAAVSVGIAGLGGRLVVQAAVIFGCAGFVGGLLLAVCLAASLPGNRHMNQVLISIGSVAYLLLPAALGGSILTRKLASHKRARVTSA
jgi:hypothetical protein